MKQLFAFALFFPIIFGIFSCEDVREAPLPPNEFNTKNVPVDSVLIPDSKTDTLCFLRVYGNQHLDTMAVKLIIKGHDVQGEMVELPFDADRKLGFIKGIFEDSIIHAAWIYDEETKRDEIQVAFRLSGNMLLQQPNIFNPAVGKFILKEGTNFSVSYNRIELSQFPKQLIRVGM